jgi:hypothetical protein
VGGQGRPQAAPYPKVQDNRPSAPVPGQVDKGRAPAIRHLKGLISGPAQVLPALYLQITTMVNRIKLFLIKPSLQARK